MACGVARAGAACRGVSTDEGVRDDEPRLIRAGDVELCSDAFGDPADPALGTAELAGIVQDRLLS